MCSANVFGAAYNYSTLTREEISDMLIDRESMQCEGLVCTAPVPLHKVLVAWLPDAASLLGILDLGE